MTNEEELELAGHHEKERFAGMVNTFLENDQIKVFFTDARVSLMEAMVNTKTPDDAGRRHLQDAIKTLDAFHGFLARAIKDGEFSKAQIKQITTGRKPIF